MYNVTTVIFQNYYFKELIMKVLFKVWNILILVVNIISVITILTAILGLGKAASDIDGAGRAIGGFALIVGVIGLIPAIITIFMARAGLKDDYEYCTKLAMIILCLDVITVFLSEDKLSGIFQIVLMLVYIYLAKSLQKSW